MQYKVRYGELANMKDDVLAGDPKSPDVTAVASCDQR